MRGAQDDPAVTLFGALCGASHSESMPLYAIHFYLHFLSKVYEATGGPSQDECVHGKTNVRLSVLAPIVQATLMDTLPNQEVADLQNAIRAKASEEADPRVDLGTPELRPQHRYLDVVHEHAQCCRTTHGVAHQHL